MNDAKLLVLVPFRNEQPFFPAFFDALDGIADQIVGLDDNSTDGSAALFRSLGGHVVETKLPIDFTQGGEVFARQTLLREGRELGGTHFLWLDADEVPSDQLRRHLRKDILSLSQGQTLELLWVNAWKDPSQYRRRRLLRDPGYRRFAQADSPGSVISGEHIHFPRVPIVPGGSSIRLPQSKGAIIHLQYCNWQRARAKQAWYQVGERVETTRSPLQIGMRYRDSRDLRPGSVKEMPASWRLSPSTQRCLKFSETTRDVGRRDLVDRTLALLDRKPVVSFESLDIWDIPELGDKFELLTGRQPKPRRIRLSLLYAADAIERVGLTRMATRVLVAARRLSREA